MIPPAVVKPPPIPEVLRDPIAAANRWRRRLWMKAVNEWDGTFEAPCPHGLVVTWTAWHIGGTAVDNSTATPRCFCVGEGA